MMEIRTAVPGDLPAFAALWELAFHDSPEVIRFVFEQFVHPENVYLAEEDGALLATGEFSYFCVDRKRMEERAEEQS